jgi:hypothetical protein
MKNKILANLLLAAFFIASAGAGFGATERERAYEITVGAGDTWTPLFDGADTGAPITFSGFNSTIISATPSQNSIRFKEIISFRLDGRHLAPVGKIAD